MAFTSSNREEFYNAARSEACPKLVIVSPMLKSGEEKVRVNIVTRFRRADSDVQVMRAMSNVTAKVCKFMTIIQTGVSPVTQTDIKAECDAKQKVNRVFKSVGKLKWVSHDEFDSAAMMANTPMSIMAKDASGRPSQGVSVGDECAGTWGYGRVDERWNAACRNKGDYVQPENACEGSPAHPGEKTGERHFCRGDGDDREAAAV
ncbi:hypothetical protein BDV06DRAFT_65294 [Aspergillus oleicola]